MKIKNNTLAMEAAPAAIPKKPRAPAIIAIIRKISVQRNIGFMFLRVNNNIKTSIKIPCHALPRRD
jgi:hypothetical protein